MKYFTSDTHFWHSAVLRHSNRPFISVEEMNDCLINNINTVVKRKDILYILGDFCWAGEQKTKEMLTRVNCKNVILVKGNHDNLPNWKYYRMGFKNVIENEYVKFQGYRVLVSHYTYSLSLFEKIKRWMFRYKSPRYEYKRIPRQADILLHGHTHIKKKVFKNMIHVGVDTWDYKPVSENQIIELIKEMK